MKRKDSFSQFLDSLRARPKHERKVIAFSSAGTITAVIAFIWVVNLVTNSELSTNSIAAGVANVSTIAEEETERNREILEQYRQRLQVEAPTAADRPEIEERYGTRFQDFTRQVVDEHASANRAASHESVRQENTVRLQYDTPTGSSNAGLDVLQ